MVAAVSTVRRVAVPPYSRVVRPEIDAPILLPPGEWFEHVQSTPGASWLIQHNLGRYPSVSIILPSGDVMITDLQHVDHNAVVATFATPTAGRAIVS